MLKKVCCAAIVIIFLSAGCKKKAQVDEQPAAADSSAVQDVDTSGHFSVVPLESQSDSIVLLFNPQLNKTYKIYNGSDFVISESDSTVTMSATSKMEGNFKLTIKSKDDAGNSIIELVETNAKETAESGGEKSEYISGQAATNPDDEFMRRIMDCMINSPVSLTMNKYSEIISSSGVEEIQKKMQQVLGDSIPVEAVQIGDPSETIQNSFIIYPEKKVMIGDTWSKEVHTNMQGAPLLIKNKYTVKDRKDGIVYITISASVVLDKNEIPKEVLSQPDMPTISGSIKGEIQVEESTGWPISSVTQQFIQTKQSVYGQSVVTNMRGTVTIRVSN